MPSYRPLRLTVSVYGNEAIRRADLLHSGGDTIGALLVLEGVVAQSRRDQQLLSGPLCGRLAALYRILARYDDEVEILERYLASEPNERDRSRYKARLVKARSLCEKHRKRDTGAHQSVRVTLAARGVLDLRSGSL